MTQRKDTGISLIRFLATAFIITYHIMQYNDFVLAWWFNVGVQIFLCMSGFLYGNREIREPLQFYKKQFLKILVDYYVVVLAVSAIQLIFVPQHITLLRFVKSVLVYGPLAGGEHLWFVPYILLCYVLTPVALGLIKTLHKKKNNTRLVLGSLLMLSVSFILFSTFFKYFNSAWINCYIVGLILGYCKHNCRSVFNKLFVVISIACIAMNSVQIYVDYVGKVQINGFFGLIYLIFCNYAHVALGCFIFLALHLVFSRLFDKKTPRSLEMALGVSDRLSYDVYLVHQFMILGPMSLMAITEHQWLNVLIIIALVLVLSVAVNYLSNMIRRLFKSKAKLKGAE